jgi:hypothetical protein
MEESFNLLFPSPLTGEGGVGVNKPCYAAECGVKNRTTFPFSILELVTHLDKRSAALGEELTKHGTMAVLLVIAITSDREICLV